MVSFTSSSSVQISSHPSIINRKSTPAMIKTSKVAVGKGNVKTDLPDNFPVPTFLRKTYDIVNSSDPTITWSDDGKVIILKDTEKFASSVIPRYFSHNKFSSFVRQLNFYGFKRIRISKFSTQGILNDDTNNKSNRTAKFYHPKFLRDRPDLLAEIRRASSQETPGLVALAKSNNSREEIDGLKRDVEELRSTVSNISADMNKLTLLVQYVMKSQCNMGKRQSRPYKEEQTCCMKKRRIATQTPALMPAPVSPSPPIQESETEQSAELNGKCNKESYWSTVPDADLFLDSHVGAESITDPFDSLHNQVKLIGDEDIDIDALEAEVLGEDLSIAFPREFEGYLAPSSSFTTKNKRSAKAA